MSMMHKFALPSEAELENLIKQVFETAPNSDQSRLLMIESRLLLKAKGDKERKLNKIPWWIVLLLAGSFATAAWWGGELLIDRQNNETSEKQQLSSDKISENKNTGNRVESGTENNDVYKHRDSSVIYQRENF